MMKDILVFPSPLVHSTFQQEITMVKFVDYSSLQSFVVNCFSLYMDIHSVTCLFSHLGKDGHNVTCSKGLH